MTPAARIQTSIVLLDQILEKTRAQGAPADRVLAEWFRANRFAGSKDRRAIRDLVYAAIRACGPVPHTGRGAMLRLAQVQPEIADLFDGSNYGPPRIGKNEKPALGGLAPDWLADRLIGSGIEGDEAAALLGRAPLDIRVNTLKADRSTLELPVAGEPLPAANGLRFPSGTTVDQWDAYRDGLIEVQDCGSQLACQALGAGAGEVVIDLCAGAGGKTIALAAAMHNTGTLIAADTDRRRLSQLGPRAERAGALVAETILLDPGKEREALAQWIGKADRVLVDAPCSGTGTWRRNPEARWRLDIDTLARLVLLQQHLIDLAGTLVRPGGHLAYVTCSLLDEEGTGQIERFLARNKNWQAEDSGLPVGTARGRGTRLSPNHDGTDGFFIARLAKA